MQKSIFIEQIKLVLGNVGSSVVPAYLLALVMAWGLSDDVNNRSLILWFLFVVTSKTVDALHAKYYLAGRINEKNVQLIFYQLLGLHAVDAVAWASLAVVSLSSATTIEFMLVNSVLAGIAGSSMSLLSPVLPLFIAFIAIEFSIVAYKFWLLGDPSYYILTATLVLYFASLSMQARNSSLAALASIKLKFENTDLMAMLRDETQKANAAHEEAVDANLAKSKFLAAASHDLRQPIHALGLFLGILSNTQLSDEQKQMVHNARSVSEASSEMLNVLLDFSRIEAQVVEVHPKPFRIQDLLFKLENEFAPQANFKNLIYRMKDSTAVIYTDPNLLELILRNFVSNAIRYTDVGGIFLSCRRRQGAWCIEVWDTGIGIPESKHKEIFREFYQLGNTERDRRKGLGLGLAIADGLAKVLSHDLTLASMPGKGSVFRITVPGTTLRPVPLAGLGTAARMAHFDGVRVLVLDDDESIRMGMGHLLQDFGCQTLLAETVDEALMLAKTHAIDLLICDYRLRDTENGVDAVRRIRELLDRQVPALLITGDTAPERLRDAHVSGIQLLHKPVAPEKLNSAMLNELQH